RRQCHRFHGALIASSKDEGANQRWRCRGPVLCVRGREARSGEPQQSLRIAEHGLDALARDLLSEQLREIASVDMLEVRSGLSDLDDPDLLIDRRNDGAVELIEEIIPAAAKSGS